MNLLTRRKPEHPMPPVTQLSLPDALAASNAGLTEQDWRQLTDPERAAYRTNISHGQHQENR